ncbi:MAG: phosphatase [Clostridiales bacterium]|nr:phosphatase [Clostridiales bacterium]
MTENEFNTIRKAKNEYQRQWRKQNPEKVKAIQERYWLRKARKINGEGEKHVETQTKS